MYCLIVILLIQQQLVAGWHLPPSDGINTLSPQEQESLYTTPATYHPDIVVLKWPPPKTYLPAHDLSTPVYDGMGEVAHVSFDALQNRQDFGNTINLVVPQSPDPVSPNEAPLPPHPYYRDLPSPHDIVNEDDDDKSPESEWKKIREKIRLKPVNHNMFKTNGKHVPTLPYAPTQPFYEIQYGIDQIRRAVHKMHPMAGLANDVFKKFNMAVKVSPIRSKDGF